jgi:hypothetical protein
MSRPLVLPLLLLLLSPVVYLIATTPFYENIPPDPIYLSVGARLNENDVIQKPQFRFRVDLANDTIEIEGRRCGKTLRQKPKIRRRKEEQVVIRISKMVREDLRERYASYASTMNWNNFLVYCVALGIGQLERFDTEQRGAPGAYIA